MFTYCSKCGAKLSETDRFCPTCGAEVTRSVSNAVPNGNGISSASAQTAATNASSGKAVTALTLGCVSLGMGFIGIFVASFILGLIGVILGMIALPMAVKSYRNGNHSSVDICALIFSIIGLVLSAIIFILGLIALIAIGTLA